MNATQRSRDAGNPEIGGSVSVTLSIPRNMKAALDSIAEKRNADRPWPRVTYTSLLREGAAALIERESAKVRTVATLAPKKRSAKR